MRDNIVTSLHVEVTFRTALVDIIEGSGCFIAFTRGDVMSGHKARIALIRLTTSSHVRIVVINIHVVVSGKPNRLRALVRNRNSIVQVNCSYSSTSTRRGAFI